MKEKIFNIRPNNCYFKLFYWEKCILFLFLLSIFSCSNQSKSTDDIAGIVKDSSTASIESPRLPEDIIYGEKVSLDEFGISYNVPESLDFLQKNNQFVSILVPKGRNAESGEMVIISPTVESGIDYTSQMQNSGFEIGTDGHHNLTASISNREAGLAANSTFIQSPEGGGLMVMYVLKDGVISTISESDFQSIVKSITHFTPTWSLENRIAFQQQQQAQQQQLTDQQKLAKLRSEHQKNQFDLQMLQLENQINR